MWGGGSAKKSKYVRGGLRNFPFRPPLRISNGIALRFDVFHLSLSSAVFVTLILQAWVISHYLWGLDLCLTSKRYVCIWFVYWSNLICQYALCKSSLYSVQFQYAPFRSLFYDRQYVKWQMYNNIIIFVPIISQKLQLYFCYFEFCRTVPNWFDSYCSSPFAELLKIWL